MSMRAGWTYDGKHFAETTTPLGGTRYFIDGKPTRKAEWQAAVKAAKFAHHNAQVERILAPRSNPPVVPSTVISDDDYLP